MSLVAAVLRRRRLRITILTRVFCIRRLFLLTHSESPHVTVLWSRSLAMYNVRHMRHMRHSFFVRGIGPGTYGRAMPGWYGGWKYCCMYCCVSAVSNI